MKENGSTFRRSEKQGDTAAKPELSLGLARAGAQPNTRDNPWATADPAAPTVYPGVTRFCRAPNSGNALGSQVVCHR